MIRCARCGKSMTAGPAGYMTERIACNAAKKRADTGGPTCSMVNGVLRQRIEEVFMELLEPELLGQRKA